MSTFDEFRSKKIKVFRNGDTWTAGKKLVISNRVYRNYEQFLSQIAENVPLTSGAVRKMYTIDGQSVKSLNDIKDGGMYVASGGDSFKKVPYLTQDDPVQEPPLKSRENKIKNRPHHSYGMLNSDINNIFNQKEKPIFGPSTKAFKLMIFVNGVVNEPVKVLLNYRNCRSFEHLLRFLSALLKLPSGQVRKVHDASNYKKITSLQDLQDGMNLVAITNDTIKKVPYQVVDPLFKAPPAPKAAPTIAHFFPNGDPYHMGLSVSITQRRFPGLQKLLDHLNNQIELVTGKIQQVYTMEGEGTKIQKLEEIENGKGYILVANNDPLIRIRYNTKAIQMAPSHGLGGITMKNEHMSRIRKVTERWSVKQQSKSFTEQPSFTESFKNEPLTQEPNRGQATPKQQKPKTASKTPRERSAVSESIQNAEGEDFPDNQDEIYGEKEVQYLSSKKSIPESTRAPVVTLKSNDESPKSINRSSAATPNVNRTSAVTSPKSVARSAIASPKSVPRSSVVSPKSVASPKSIARSSIASPNAISRTNTASDGKSLAQSELEEESRPQSEVKTSKNAISRKESKEALKSGKASNEALSNKGSQGNLRAGGKEKIVSTKGSQDIDV